MHSVLVVEDEEKLLRSLQRGLTQEGYAVAAAATGEEGYYLATTRPVDAVVLDLMLPGRDGVEVLRDLRSRGFSAPIGAARFHAMIGIVLIVHAAFATLLASLPRREGTLGKMRLSPIAKALRERMAVSQ